MTRVNTWSDESLVVSPRFDLYCYISPGSRTRQALQVLHASLDVAVDDGLIARNPTDRVKAPRVEKRRQLFLTAIELGRLADEATPYDTLVWFLGWSGLRWGEAVALRVGRVDGRRVRVEESATEIGGKLEWGRPKSNEARTVIVPNLVASRLAPLIEGKQSDDLVFTTEDWRDTDGIHQ